MRYILTLDLAPSFAKEGWGGFSTMQYQTKKYA